MKAQFVKTNLRVYYFVENSKTPAWVSGIHTFAVMTVLGMLG